MGNVKSVSDNYLVQLIDDYIGVATEFKPILIGLPRIDTLPNGKTYIIKDETNDASTYNVTIYGTDSSLIDNVRTYTINSDGGTVQIAKNGGGTGWSVVSLPSYSVTYNTYTTVTNNVYTTVTNNVYTTVTNTYSVTTYVMPEEYGAVGDGTTDDSHAINLAITSAAALGKGLWLNAKTYFCNSSITVAVNLPFLRGQGPTSILKFYKAVNGLVVVTNRSVISDFKIISNGSVAAWASSASCVAGVTAFYPSAGYSGLILECTVTGTSGSEPAGPLVAGNTYVSGSATFVAKHIAGLKVRSNGSTFERLIVSAIAGNGCELDSTTGDNCNLNEFYNCKFDSNLGYGANPKGADSNVNFFAQCSFVSNILGGAFDQSALGNFWISPHFDSNVGLAFDMYDTNIFSK
jgi:hypothetical protein